MRSVAVGLRRGVCVLWNKTRQDRQCTYNVILRSVRTAIVAMQKQQLLTYYECVSAALGIRDMSYVAIPAFNCYSTLTDKRHD